MKLLLTIISSLKFRARAKKSRKRLCVDVEDDDEQEEKTPPIKGKQKLIYGIFIRGV